MLYKHNLEKELSNELFKNPTSEYRGTPFWAWNCRLDGDELLRQIDVLKQMGFGGFHMHVRSGMATEYLSEDFMALIRKCVDKAKDEKMLAWLYDEDRWPSGFAGGLVTKDPQYRQRYLLFTAKSYETCKEKSGIIDSLAVGGRTNEGRLVARYDVELDENGCLLSYRLLKDGEAAEHLERFAYLELSEPTPRFNDQSYVNTLDKKAIERFIEITHETYKKHVGNEFSKSIPAIFTDEPQFSRKETLTFADSETDVTLPWTDDIDETYIKKYGGKGLIEQLPELFWDLPDGKVSVARHHYHDHLCDRFTEAFADTCGKWCHENNIMLTGHMMNEPSLYSQTTSLGEAMRSYRAFELPGIDMLCNSYELTTAKQAQSASHQYGREGVLSELYGVTGWDFDFRGHKLQGDWQAALGVSVRVPHLAWVSMEGEAKRDYPACINYQSSWYEKYAYVEDHFARVNTAMTRGKPEIRVAVIHPIESYWLHFGPSEQTALIRNKLEDRFHSITEWLLYGLVDFDFISESLLPSLADKEGSPKRVGEMEYDVILVPACETLRKTTVEFLESYAKTGRLIFVGEPPKYIDALPSERGKALYDKCEQVSFDKGAILGALENVRIVDIRNSNGAMTNNLLHQLRRDGNDKWLFIAEGNNYYNPDVSYAQKIKVSVKGKYKVLLYNTLDGKIEEIPYSHISGKTVVEFNKYKHDSYLLRLIPTDAESKKKSAVRKEAVTALPVPETVPYTLGEPNVFLLDKAEYALDGEEYNPEEEILRADSKCRIRLGWTPWDGGANQPWCIKAEPEPHEIKVRFRLKSDIEVANADFAMENPEDAKVVFNGKNVSIDINGYFVDKSIKTFTLGRIKKGKNVIEITMPFATRTAVEWCYVLGDFGVNVLGSTKKIVERNPELAFESITTQTLPFYSGTLTYHFDVESNGGKFEIRVPQYRAGVLAASVDGGDEKTFAFAPYTCELGALAPGRHRIDLKLYLPRTNAFGALHLADENLGWKGPNMWRTNGDAWTESYRLSSEGLLTAPIIREKI